MTFCRGIEEHKIEIIMKKVLFFVVAISAMVNVSAQSKFRPEGNSFSTELNYSFGGGQNDGALVLPEYGAKLRFFTDDKWVVRLSVGVGTDTSKETVYLSDNDDQKTISKTSHINFSILPGFEYHFNKFERVFPYVGAEIGVLTNMSKTLDKTDNGNSESSSEWKRPGIGFAVNALTGVDVYLCKGFYVGFELGLGYSQMNMKKGTTTETVGDYSNIRTDGNETNLDSSFGFHATPSLRVGWHF